MRKLILDVENTTTELTDKYRDFSPYNPNNRLVSIGWAWLEDNKVGEIKYLFLHHKEDIDDYYIAKHNIYPHEHKDLRHDFLFCIRDANVIIAHNAKYDLQWLAEAGFDVMNKKIEDTMIREYVMARGRTDFSFRLADTCKRYGVAEKGEIFEKYPDLQISEMPIGEVEEYGRGDIQACGELYLAQEERLNRDSYHSLHKTVDMMNEFCQVLAGIERSGVKIDEEALKQVETDFTDEKEKLTFDLNALVKSAMGDTKINLDSPKQLSEVIYSRRIKAGQEDEWLTRFNIAKDARGKHVRRPKMDYSTYAGNVKQLTDHVLKTKVSQCKECIGTGKIQKIRKDGTPFKNETRCKPCAGSGAIYTEVNEVAGFKMKPKNIAFTTVNGFSISKGFLTELIDTAKYEGKKEAEEFLTKLMRLSAISSHLSNFVGGINAFKQADNTLHPNFNQCITATGRLSSTKPNLQNQPREATFPIRRVFVSRFSGGCITEVDFAQLEFRAAIHLAKDEKGREHINGGLDIHSQTASIITQAGQPITRQDAKSRTFKPLFGGVTGTEAEKAYYKAFLKEIYTGVGHWHKELQEEAISKKIITLPTGRQYIFPDVERAWHGGATKYTQIVNYPVQGFATADIVPLAIIRLHKEMQKRNLKSLIVLTVHDSIAVDTHPDEVEIIKELTSNVGKYAEEELKSRYGIEMFVPLTVEVKCGTNLMEMKKVA